MLESQKEMEKNVLTLCGHRVCQRSFRLLLGIGKSRVRKLRNAIIHGHECPLDARYIPKKHETLCLHMVQLVNQCAVNP